MASVGHDSTPGAADTESDVEAFLIRSVSLRGGTTRKIQYIGRRGCPDRLIVLPFIGLQLAELKRPKGGVYSVHQVEDQCELAEVGYEVLKFHTRQQIHEWFMDYDREWDL